jgi:hypothetical protein
MNACVRRVPAHRHQAVRKVKVEVATEVATAVVAGVAIKVATKVVIIKVGTMGGIKAGVTQA